MTKNASQPASSSPDTTTATNAGDAEAFAQNAQKIAEQCQKILNVYMEQQAPHLQDRPLHDSLHIYNAFSQLFEQMLHNPEQWWDLQMSFWQDYMELWNQTLLSLSGEQAEPVISPDAKDRRFKDEAWQNNVIFDFIKQSYLLTAAHIHESVESVDGLDNHTRQKIEFYTKQYVDAMAPSNFLMTNPQVLRATLESKGENLVKGLEHVLEDLQKGHGSLRISMTDEDAFAIGKNLATTPGKVVFENELMQLIQYTPTTDKVHATPLLMIPAWINKYYILDLRESNSLVKWAVDQGYTVFVISWVNPTEELRAKTFEDYLNEGPLAALDAIEAITGEKQTATLGYCLGGTLLACLLAYLHGKGQEERIASATFLTAMTDFSHAGDLSVFIDEEQLSALESRMEKRGILEGREMATTFSMLRANDLIWSFVVNNYLLGKEPFPFDLLYWNGDSTRMPAVMHSFYLRKMYLQNKLVQPGGITLNGVKLDLRKITTPSYFLSTREDHIAPWQATYTATQLFSGPMRFVLAASGHVAGVINPPAKNKYSYWLNNELPEEPDTWLAMAENHEGSWWKDWQQWQSKHAGKQVAARKPGGKQHPPIEDAPGRYVQVKSD